MKIDGKLIAQKILDNLKLQIRENHLSPTLTVIQVGEDPASTSYIKQKEKAALFIGAKIINKNLPENVSPEKIKNLIGELNENPEVQGIIVQLPLPSHLEASSLQTAINPQKDVDGFLPNSPFIPPVAGAVLKVLEEIKKSNWKFLVIGRGVTAGKPIAETLVKKGYQVEIAHSQTAPEQFNKLAKSADIIISCVGKADVIKASDIKPGAIVIGVGLHRSPESKLTGDFNEEEVSKVASFYSPTPGGVGPINVACLMENLVLAART